MHFPPFNPLLPSAILLFLLASAPLSAIPPPFFSSSLSGPRIVFRRSHNQSQFCNPTFSSSLQSSTSQPTTLARLQSHAILTRNSFFFYNRGVHRTPSAILLGVFATFASRPLCAKGALGHSSRLPPPSAWLERRCAAHCALPPTPCDSLFSTRTTPCMLARTGLRRLDLPMLSLLQCRSSMSHATAT